MQNFGFCRPSTPSSSRVFVAQTSTSPLAAESPDPDQETDAATAARDGDAYRIDKGKKFWLERALPSVRISLTWKIKPSGESA